MQLNFAALATLAAALAATAPAALGATCYPQSGCQQCENPTSLEAARQNFCGGSGWQHPASFAWGWARIRLDGEFATQQECWDGFQNVIDQCLGRSDGGVYTFDFDGDAARLDVGFCNCE